MVKVLERGHYPPQHLADRILATRVALEGERKQVTVLFADIKGSLELLAGRDPEDANHLLDAVLHRMMDAVHRYEGTVSQARGDGVMAIFGAPVAHEDHAVRACYAALKMQEMIASLSEDLRRADGMSVQTRVGLNSGEVVVRSIRNDLYMEYTAVGQTTHLAARMEQIAAPGKIFATADTVRLVEGYVDVRPLGSVTVRGMATPVEAFEVVGAGLARSRLQTARGRGLTPFVGRDAEMAALRDALAAAAAGSGQMAAVTGEPGVGKSRLVYEFVHSADTAGWTVLESTTNDLGHHTPYAPVIDLLRAYFKIGGLDNASAIRDKVTGRMLLGMSFLQEDVPPLLDLLDVLPPNHPFRSADPELRRQSAFRAVARLLQNESRIRPVVAVLDNLDRDDALTLGLLGELMAHLRVDRVLLLVTQRRASAQHTTRDTGNYLVRLEPLPLVRCVDLMTALLGAEPSVALVKPFVWEHAGGNPFFVEEIVRTLFETGVLAGARGAYRLEKTFLGFRMPATIQSVLASRIDRLPANEKRVLQDAAVIGNKLPFELLRAISGLAMTDLRRVMEHLVSAEMLIESRLFPDAEYAFRHALTHEVAYSELLKSRRSEIHARIVGAIENLYGNRLGEWLERLAQHAFNGQLWGKALTYLRQAGVKAADRQAYREATALFERALEVVAQLPENDATIALAIDIRFDIRNALQPLGDREGIERHLHAAQALATRINDAGRLGWVQAYFTDHYWILGRPEEAAKAGEKALAIARACSDLPLQVVTNLPLGLIHHTQGDYPRAMGYFDWNASQLDGPLLKQRFGLFVLPSTFSRSFSAWCLAEMGEFMHAVSAGEGAVRISLEAEHQFSCGCAFLGMGVVHLRKGDIPLAISALEKALAAGGFADSPVGMAYVTYHLGYALALSGSLSEGLDLLERNVALAESKAFVARHALRLAYLGEAYLLAGRAQEAEATTRRALRLAREHRERANEAYVLRVMAEAALGRGAVEEAMDSFQAAIDLSRELRMKPLQAHCHDGLARLLAAGGKTAQAQHHRGVAQDMVATMGMRMWSHTQGGRLGESDVEARLAAR